jgi:hypothetical protein
LSDKIRGKDHKVYMEIWFPGPKMLGQYSLSKRGCRHSDMKQEKMLQGEFSEKLEKG